GERMARLLTTLGMKDGEAIESRMVTRQIEKAQKKVEEQHFEARKNLLEYDEVMDHQRKRVYGFRQKILDGHNGKLLILDMLDRQIDANVDRLLDDEYGPASFAEFAANRLGVEFDGADFRGSDFEQAAQFARDKASRNVPSVVQEAMDENLPADVEEGEWQWQALAGQMGRRYDLKLTDRDLKKIGRDELPGWLIEQADTQIANVDLSDGAKYLQPDWGLKSVCDWVRLKFRIEIKPEELAGQAGDQIKAVIHTKVRDLYRQKEVEFPVQAAVGRFLGDKTPSAAGPRYDRAGLFVWAKMRFPGMADDLSEDEFRTQPKSRLQEVVMDLSRRFYPATPQGAIDGKLAEAFEGA